MTGRNLDDHNVYFHTLDDLVHRYRDAADEQVRGQLREIIEALISNREQLGLSLDEVRGIQAHCCGEFVNLQAIVDGQPPGHR